MIGNRAPCLFGTHIGRNACSRDIDRAYGMVNPKTTAYLVVNPK